MARPGAPALSVDGRLVLNAYLGGELVGSAIVSSHEADEDEQRETAWTLADARFSPSGPYFGDPDLFAEPCFLHFESLYTWRDVRRRGVAAALIEAVSEIGLPTFAEFRPKWLPDVFERWRVTEENQDETLFWTQEGAGGSLGVALSPRRRLRLMIYPVVLGAGERLFGETSGKKPMRLVDTQTVGDDLVFLTYEPARDA
jgi:GNAT superfamily N-acetyltransferase